jgi:AraC family transcriptional regulator
MKRETRSFYEAAVEKTATRVATALDEALDLQALARAAGLSPFHFHRVVRGLLGETALELHRRLRLERAAWALGHGAAPVTEVAFAAGYETHESFTRAFRDHYDCSPSEFRENRMTDGARGTRPRRIELAAASGIHFTPERAPLRVHFIAGGRIAMKVEIKEMPALRLGSVRHAGPYNRIPEAFKRLNEIAVRASLGGPGTTLLAIYHDDPETTPAAELRSEAAVTLAPDAALPAGLEERRLAAGRYAFTTHVGPYEQLGDVWVRLIGDWLPRSGHRLRDAESFELYRNTPGEVPAAELVTELYIPLEPPEPSAG